MEIEIFSLSINLGLIIAIFEILVYTILRNTPGIGVVYGGGITGWAALLTGAIIASPSIEILGIIALVVVIVILIIYMLAGRIDMRGSFLDNLPHLGKFFAIAVPLILALIP